ncbi:MAG: ABC transporter permease [Cytophagales bacterium]|nr:ABC transporter permease [Cytophagales bacterium]
MKLLFRRIGRHWINISLNFGSLLLGLVSFLLILNYVIFEYSYDTFHEGSDRIYRMYVTAMRGDEALESMAVLSAPIAPEIQKAFPEVEASVRIRTPGNNAGYNVVTFHNKSFVERTVAFVDPSFFDVFNFPIVQGDDKQPLDEPNSIVISEAYAKKYFENKNPIGRVLKFKNLNSEYLCKVTAVSKVPENSHLNFDMFINLNTYFSAYDQEKGRTDWAVHGFYSYMRLREGTEPREFEKRYKEHLDEINAFAKSIPELDFYYLMQPLDKVHFETAHLNYSLEGRKVSKAAVDSLLMLSLLTIIISWFNFTNLSMHRYTLGTRDIAIRKIMGSSKISAVKSYFYESLLVSFAATVAAILVTQMILPSFNELVGLDLSYYIFNYPIIWISMILFLLSSAMISSGVPGIVMAKINPINTIRSKNVFVSNKFTRRLKGVLIVSQLVAILALSLGSYTVYQQISYMLNMEVGADIENTIILREPIEDRTGDTHVQRLITLKERLERSPQVESVCISSDVPTIDLTWNELYSSDHTETDMSIGSSWIDPDFVGAYNINILAGRSFEKDRLSDSTSVVMNQSAMYLLGFKDPEEALNSNITRYGQQLKVVGIMDDYHTTPMRKAQTPVIYNYINSGKYQYVSVKYNSNSLRAIDTVTESWESVYTTREGMEFFFLNEHFGMQYDSEKYFAKVMLVLALISIILGVFGIYGILHNDIAARTKEIAMRKVLGSTNLNVIFVLSKEILQFVLIATVLGWVLIYYIIRQWLENYAYSIDMPVLSFFLGGLLILLIAVLSILSNVFSVVGKKPIQALKAE